MHLFVKPKKLKNLFPTDIIFQTEYWAQVKARLGWQPCAYDIGDHRSKNDLLVLTKPLGPNVSAAYVPQGPEFAPNQESYGSYLEALSESIANQIDSEIAFILYDLPWESPYSEILNKGPGYGIPNVRIREIRMNFGTQLWNFRKAPMDMTVADSYIIDISQPEKTILDRMKSKTRYNIGLALRKGVKVYAASIRELPIFYELYFETAKRNGFLVRDYQYFLTLFSSHGKKSDSSEILLMLACHGEEVLAGAIITITEKTAYFLHGASKNVKRNLMSCYALHWEIIQYARSLKCRDYDMGAVSPANFPDHPFFGLYRFKSGFGGRIFHRIGSWDYPIDQDTYSSFRNWEETNRGVYENGRNLLYSDAC